MERRTQVTGGSATSLMSKTWLCASLVGVSVPGHRHGEMGIVHKGIGGRERPELFVSVSSLAFEGRDFGRQNQAYYSRRFYRFHRLAFPSLLP
jgi:hypothetical protein